jgi:kynurenine formamidase
MNHSAPHVRDLLAKAPKNWGRWGDDDEIGALNLLTPAEVLRAARSVRSGKTFTLGLPIAHPSGDPIWPGRRTAQRVNLLDQGVYLAGAGPSHAGGHRDAEDMIIMNTQGSTQYDALGHVWYDDLLWNGFAATETVGGSRKASVYALAEKGIVGHAVLIDIARHRGKDVLERGETFTHRDLLEAAAAQGTLIGKRDILLIRTGWIGTFYRSDPKEFYRDFLEPGITYSPELLDWFQDMEIPNLCTDTIGSEVTIDPITQVELPLHAAFLRDMGVLIAEMLSLDALADDCAADGQWDFLYVAGPLKIYGGTGSPVNPVAIK